MKNVKNFYIIGEPIETDVGKCAFLKVKDYPQYIGDMQLISLSKDQIYQEYYEANKDGSLDSLLENIKNMTLYEIAVNISELQSAYYNIFLKVFNNESAIEKITPDNFDSIRQLIMDMNCLKEEEINPNPEIQKAIERSKRVKSQEAEKTEFADLVSSIVTYCGITYNEVNNMTIYQFYMTFQRIAQFKNYDTSTLFATVAGDKVKIDSWSKHINLYEEEKHFVTQEEFKKNTGSIFDE